MSDNFGEIIIRKPLFSYDFLFKKNGETKIKEELFEYFLNDKKFLEAIYWSSIPFYKILLDYKNGKIFEEKKKKKILLSLKKYIIRSATRPTPFGTFAGISHYNLSNPKLNNTEISKRKLRIDLSILSKIIKSIEKEPLFSSHLFYRINNTLYDIHNQFRFFEIDANDESRVQISSLEKSDILKKLVADFKTIKFNFLSFYLKFQNDFEKEELLIFFQELIEMRFLINDIEINLTAKDDFYEIKKFLNKIEIKNTNEALTYSKLIQKIENYIFKIENAPLGEFFANDYEEIIFLFRKVGIFINDEQIFQVDLINNGEDNFCFSKNDLKNVKESLKILSQLSLNDNINSEIEVFKRIFSEKYETKSLPLLEALDIDSGVGFPANQSIGSNNSSFFDNRNDVTTPNNNLNLSEWLIDKIESDNNTRILEIFDTDFYHINCSNKFPNTFYVVGQVLDDDKILIQNVGGAFGNTLLSRFNSLNYNIEDLCKRISDYEKKLSPEVIFADIVWIENHKVANISRRVSYLDYEIPIFYKSYKNIDNIILLEDLLVSVQNDEVILISKKHKKRVIPRLSSAHNYNQSNNPVYRFLCSIQNQKNYKFDLNPDFKNSFKRYFPRIFYKNIILFPAHWIIHKKDIKLTTEINLESNSLKNYFKKWEVSKYVLLVQGDNELLIDIENDDYLEIVIDELKKNDQIILKESFIDPLKKNCYTNQFVLPLRKNQPITEKSPRNEVIYSNNLNRNYFPGSEWIYFKIYCSTNISNDILIEIYEKIILFLKNEGLIQKWFFVRYFDPHHHIRLRLNVTSNELGTDVYNLLYKKLNKFILNKLIWKINIDTYQREIERYGLKNIEKSESLFHWDSELFLSLLKYNQLESTEMQLCLAIKNIDLMISQLNIEPFEKMDLFEIMKNKLSKEKSKQFLVDAEVKYRNFKAVVFDFMDNNEFPFSINHYKEIKNLKIQKENIFDYIHMSVNRWFSHNQRDWEYLLYLLCSKYYGKIAHKTKLKL